jgi:hypothetical protein
LWGALRDFLGLEPESPSILNGDLNEKSEMRSNGQSDEEKIRQDLLENEAKVQDANEGNGDEAQTENPVQNKIGVSPDVKICSATETETSVVPNAQNSCQTTGKNVSDRTNSANIREDSPKQTARDVTKCTDGTNFADGSSVTDVAEVTPSLLTSVPPLSESGLTLPPVSEAYLQIEYKDEEVVSISNLEIFPRLEITSL